MAGRATGYNYVSLSQVSCESPQMCSLAHWLIYLIPDGLDNERGTPDDMHRRQQGGFLSLGTGPGGGVALAALELGNS